MNDNPASAVHDDRNAARGELKAFLFLTVVTAPVIAVLVISGYGFLVWIYQMFAGPPGA